MAAADEREARVVAPSSIKSELLLRSLEGKERLGRSFDYTVELLTTDINVELSELIGQTLRVELETSHGQTRNFHGYVSEFLYLGVERNHARYRAVLRPWLWLLRYRKNSRIFQQKSALDAIKAIFAEHGFSSAFSTEGVSRSSYQTFDFLVQYQESDYDFVHRLLEQEGIYYYYEHSKSGHKLCLCDSSNAHEAVSGYEKIGYMPPGNTANRSEEHVDDWRSRQQVRSGAVAMGDFDFEKPRADLGVKQQVSSEQFKLASPATTGQRKLELYEWPGQYIVTNTGQTYARDHMERALAGAEIAEASGVSRGLATGYTFKLQDHPRDPENRDYLVLSTWIELRLDPRESSAAPARGQKGEGGFVFRSRLECIPAKTPYRSPMDTPRPRVIGPQTAVVVGPSGREIWTDKYGRIKVQFHWDREGQKNEDSSCWIRVSQSWAGAKWGAMHIPRIGQEVVVEFLDGDPNRPIVTGRVYNADNMPPYELSKNQTQSGFKSRSSEKGGVNDFNELRFEDAKDKEHVYLQAQKDLQILVKNDETREVQNDRTEKVVKNDTVTIGENRTEEVGKDEKITIKGNRTEQVDLDEKVTVKGNQTLTVEKDRKDTVKGGLTEQVDKDVSTRIGGNRTSGVTGKETTSVDGDVSRSIKGKEARAVSKDQSASIGGDQKIAVGGAVKEEIGGDLSQKVGGSAKQDVSRDASVEVGGGYTLTVTGDVEGKGKKVTLESSAGLTLKTGSASITLKPSGEVEIKGLNVKIEASAKLDVKGGAMVTVKGGMVQVG